MTLYPYQHTHLPRPQMSSCLNKELILWHPQANNFKNYDQRNSIRNLGKALEDCPRSAPQSGGNDSGVNETKKMLVQTGR